MHMLHRPESLAPQPDGLRETGLSENLLKELVCKHLHDTGVQSVGDLARRLHLSGGVTTEILERLRAEAIALDQQVRVHVWIVASRDFFNASGATALKDLSIRTGGTYALFSGSESLPDPEVYLTPLRHSYTLAYDSSIRSTGTHTLHARVDYAGGTLTSDSLTLPFTPVDGFIYTLDASFSGVTGDTDWLALGFAKGQAANFVSPLSSTAAISGSPVKESMTAAGSVDAATRSMSRTVGRSRRRLPA